MPGRARTVSAAIAVALLVVAPLVLLFAGGGDDEGAETARGLRIESFGSELILSVESAANVPASAGGARSVTIRCVDSDDQLVAEEGEGWPFTDTDGDTRNAHVHMGLDPAQLQRIRSCRLIGTEPMLEATAP